MTETLVAVKSGIDLNGQLPGAPVPYVIRYGEGRRANAAGQVVYTLAGDRETDGGFGVMLGELPFDPIPIPLHYHEREHDTWVCLRGRLQVWCNDESRVLTPGDFAYVRPGDVHAYRSLAPRSSFFGIVAPGGWENFFIDAGEVWGMTALPPAGHPFDFSRMGPAMAKHDVHPVPDAKYGPATPMSEADQVLPNEHRSYFLDAGYGDRRLLLGHLVTSIMVERQSNAAGEIRLIEAPKDASVPELSHEKTTVFLFVLAGSLAVSFGGEEVVVTGGDGVNLPRGTEYSTRVESGTARWLMCSANGNGASFWDAGETTEAHCFTGSCDTTRDHASLRAVSGVDFKLG